MKPDFIKQALYSPHLDFHTALLLLAVAVVLGAIHALGPGHGKSLMAAYLVGSKGRVLDAVVMALTLTVSHVASVIVVALIALLLTNIFWPEWISRWIGLFSGLSILSIGFWLLLTRYRNFKSRAGGVDSLSQHTGKSEAGSAAGKNAVCISAKATDEHGSGDGHDGSHHHYEPGLSMWSNVALGISAGIIPCPKAIVILLLAISLHKVALGIIVILAFSLGIAVTLVVLGVSVLRAGDVVRRRFADKKIEMVPLFGSLIVVGLGIFLTVRTTQLF